MNEYYVIRTLNILEISNSKVTNWIPLINIDINGE